MALDAESRLVLIRVKIERAKKHFLHLETDIGNFRNDRLNVLTGNQGPPNFTNLPVLPFDILPAAGDVIHNLRSSLDHLACQLVIVAGREPTKDTAFPIFKDVTAYEAYKTRKVEGMRELAIKHIDNLKPYKGGNQFLWRLNELDNIDKHRTLFTVKRDYLFIADWLRDGGPYWLETNDPHFAGLFDPDVEKDFQLEIEKSVSKVKVTDCDALLPSLQKLISCTEELLFGFKPLLE